MSELVRVSLNYLVYGFPSVMVIVSLLRMEGELQFSCIIVVVRNDVQDRTCGSNREGSAGSLFPDVNVLTIHRNRNETGMGTKLRKLLENKNVCVWIRVITGIRGTYPHLLWARSLLRKLRNSIHESHWNGESVFILFYLFLPTPGLLKCLCRTYKLVGSDESNHARRLKFTRFETVCKHDDAKAAE